MCKCQIFCYVLYLSLDIPIHFVVRTSDLISTLLGGVINTTASFCTEYNLSEKLSLSS